MKIINNKIEDINPNIVINDDVIFNIIDLHNTVLDIDLTFDVSSNCIINFSSCTYDVDKQIKVRINLLKSNIDVKLNINSLTIGNVKTTIELCGTNPQKICDSAIDMQVSGIISSAGGKISCVPMYDFSTNLINATHGVTMGTFSEEQLFNLLVKGIKINDAKTMIIWSKFNMSLDGISEQEKQSYYQLILDKWNE